MTNLTRLASATLDGTNSYFEIISFTNRDGKELQIAVRASYAAKDSKLADCLRDAGIADEDSPSIVLRAKELLSTAARYSGTIVIDGGWHGKPGKRFVFGDEIIPPPRRRARSGKPGTRPPRKLFACPSFRLKEPMNFIGRNSVPGGADGFSSARGRSRAGKRT